MKDGAFEILAILVLLSFGATLLILMLAARWAAQARAAAGWRLDLDGWHERRRSRLSRQRAETKKKAPRSASSPGARNRN